MVFATQFVVNIWLLLNGVWEFYTTNVSISLPVKHYFLSYINYILTTIQPYRNFNCKAGCLLWVSLKFDLTDIHTPQLCLFWGLSLSFCRLVSKTSDGHMICIRPPGPLPLTTTPLSSSSVADFRVKIAFLSITLHCVFPTAFIYSVLSKQCISSQITTPHMNINFNHLLNNIIFMFWTWIMYC